MSKRYDKDIEFLLSKESHFEYLSRILSSRKLLGSGSYAQTFELDSNTVVRIGNDDLAYVKWVEHCLKNKENPHVPKIRNHYNFLLCEKECYKKIAYKKENFWAVKGQCYHCQTFSLTFLEKLSPLSKSPKSLELKYCKLFEEQLGFEAKHYDAENIREFKKKLKKVKKEDNLLAVLLSQVCEIVDSSSYNIDLHSENFLKRKDGTVVISDPLCY